MNLMCSPTSTVQANANTVFKYLFGGSESGKHVLQLCNNPTDSEEMQQCWMHLFQSYTTQCQNSERNQHLNHKFILLKPTQFGFKTGHKTENSLVFSIGQEQTSALVLYYFAVTRLHKPKILLIHSRKVARSQGYGLKWLYKWIHHHQFPYSLKELYFFPLAVCSYYLVK